jgi:hypothetical protein
VSGCDGSVWVRGSWRGVLSAGAGRVSVGGVVWSARPMWKGAPAMHEHREVLLWADGVERPSSGFVGVRSLHGCACDPGFSVELGERPAVAS